MKSPSSTWESGRCRAATTAYARSCCAGRAHRRRRRIIRAAGFDEARVLAAFDERAGQIAQQLAGACRRSSIESDRERLCLNIIWRDHQQQLRRIARNTSREAVASALDEVAAILPATRCSDRNPPSQLPLATPTQLATYDSLRARIDVATTDQGAHAIAALDAIRAEIEANGHVELTLDWYSALVSELSLAGDYVRAGREIEAARHLAQANGGDAELAWFTTARLRVAILTNTATDALEADVDALVTRVGNPLLTAAALQARGERALDAGSFARALELLTSAIDLLVNVCVIPSTDLHSAHMLRAGALQQLGKLVQAQLDLDRAVEVARARFPPDHIAVAWAETARANDWLHAGKLDDAGRAFGEIRAALSPAHRDRTALAVTVDVGLCQVELTRQSPRAGEACETAVATSEAVYGETSLAVIGARNQLAQVLLGSDNRRAIEILEQTLQIAGNHANSGHDPFDIPQARALLALAYDLTTRHADGCVLAEQAIAAFRQTPQHPMIGALEARFPELANGGRCHRR
jgi:tetratricopeptide (TPR) repeat protein